VTVSNTAISNAFCGQAYPAVKMLLKRFGDRVRFVYRPFPLVEGILKRAQRPRPPRRRAAQHKFWPMHDLLFEHPQHLKATT